MTPTPRATLDLARPEHAHLQERLERDLIVWISSTRPDGRPHLVPVWFLWQDGELLMFSKPDQKVRNLRAHPAVVFALDNTDTGEDVALIEGVARLLPEGEAPTPDSLSAYAQKYAGKLTEMGWTPASMAQSYTQAIRITPTRFL
ncbi:MAG TPA: pyridoxamine 5'-phosphate oxidase family protein [Ktedonobacterales bacterium]|nr:pyridoxamine 5'-phosphate oxidase family protein [Ktedonobacterales bacterium]